ncbi:hypothetical protein OH491_10430 [Termitidicoccus mucosus]|uniref:Uncharacterized protein n=1 Tax=Termitidicoccus mucosus TaxID=1184151 RepID=A0A178IET0_9BACT|nr:hypothetical protein AW736_16915 [Opitutaceae bacterium TSB47]
MNTTQPPPDLSPANPDAATPSAPPVPPPDDAPAEPLALKERHRAPFAQARDTLVEQYGVSPAPDELLRLWITTATPWQVVRVFEESVLNLTGSDLAGTGDEQILLGL